MLTIYAIPAFQDNYLWLIQPDSTSPATIIVDPGDAQPVIEFLDQHSLDLTGILLTHHHHDHVDGAVALSESFSLPIHGPRSARMPQVTEIVTDNQLFTLANQPIQVVALPGHTLDLIGYQLQDPKGQPHLFSADALFGAGCGRLFDGTASMHFASLQRIAAFPDNTLIYGAHEYTLANIEFALFIEPDNADLIRRKDQEQEKRNNGIPTLPLDLALEKRTNPFLRCHLPQIKARAETLAGQPQTSDAEVFACLRRAKDAF